MKLPDAALTEKLFYVIVILIIIIYYENYGTSERKRGLSGIHTQQKPEAQRTADADSGGISKDGKTPYGGGTTPAGAEEEPIYRHGHCIQDAKATQE